MPLIISSCDSSTAHVKTRPFPLAAEGGQWAMATPDTPGWESSSDNCAPLGPWLSVNKYIYINDNHIKENVFYCWLNIKHVEGNAG